MENGTRPLLIAQLLLVCATIPAAAPCADAQEVSVGTRVKITYDAQRSGVMRIARGGSHQSIGTLVRRDSGAYVVASPKRETVVAANLVRRVEVSEGRHRNVAGGALVAAAGAAGGILALHFALVAPLGGEIDGAIYPAIVAGSALLGAVTGYAFPQERWKRQR